MVQTTNQYIYIYFIKYPSFRHIQLFGELYPYVCVIYIYRENVFGRPNAFAD